MRGSKSRAGIRVVERAPCPAIKSSRIRQATWALRVLGALLFAGPCLCAAMQGAESGRPNAAATTPPPVTPWAALTPQEQQFLAPVRDQWQQLPPQQQQRLRRTAARWQNMPPEQQQRVHQRLVRFADSRRSSSCRPKKSSACAK
jgi:hypothetical protein